MARVMARARKWARLWLGPGMGTAKVRTRDGNG